MMASVEVKIDGVVVNTVEWEFEPWPPRVNLKEQRFLQVENFPQVVTWGKKEVCCLLPANRAEDRKHLSLAIHVTGP